MRIKSTLEQFVKSKGFSLAVITIVLIVIFQIMNSNYLSGDNLRSIMNACSLSGTITVGMACLLMSGTIDLSSGAIGCLSGVLVAVMIKTGMAWPLAVLLTILFGISAGWFNAFLANILNFMPFIATIGMASVWQGVALVITGSQNITINNHVFWELGTATLWVFPLPFLIMIVLMAVYGFMIARTRFGRRIMLCGGNKNAARLAGINPKRMTTVMFINNGAIAALAGTVLAARMHNGSPTSVLGSEMDGITAAIIGGVSFMGGGSSGMGAVFLGLAMLNIFKNGLTVIRLPAYWQIISQGVLLILALLLDYLREQRRVRALKATPVGEIKA